jgi:hypothetical protein
MAARARGCAGASPVLTGHGRHGFVSNAGGAIARFAHFSRMTRFSAAAPVWNGEPYRHERIRLAYVSADFHAHATAVLTAGCSKRTTRRSSKPSPFPLGPNDDSPIRRRLEAAFEHFIDVQRQERCGSGAASAAKRNRYCGRLKGYTDDSRPGIFAHRPAPLQVNYLGFPQRWGRPISTTSSRMRSRYGLKTAFINSESGRATCRTLYQPQRRSARAYRHCHHAR